MTTLTIIQRPDCAEHVALLERMGLRTYQPDPVQVHARSLVAERRCAYCGELFTRRTNRAQRYCCVSCRFAAKADEVTR